MASFPRSKGKYHTVIFTRTVAGKKQRKYFYFSKKDFTRTEIEAWRREREKAYKAGWDPWSGREESPQPKMRLKELIEAYKAEACRSLAESTLDRNIDYLNNMMAFVGEDIPGAELVNEWIDSQREDSQKAKYRTRLKRMQVANSLFRFAVEKKIIDKAPQLRVISTRAERKAAQVKDKDWMNSQELEALIQDLHRLDREIKANRFANSRATQKHNRLRPDLELVFRMVHKTGMRLNDIHNFDLQWIRPDPVLEGKRIIQFSDYTPKSQKLNEKIPVMPEIDHIIDMLLERGERFPFKEMSKEWISKTFKKCLPPEKNMSFRNLRDSAANYWLYEKGLPVNIVQQILRHSDIKTTMIYVHDNLTEVQRYVWGEK